MRRSVLVANLSHKLRSQEPSNSADCRITNSLRSNSLRAIFFLAIFFLSEAVGYADWKHWRGPNANGSSDTADPPVKWSETENVRWKVAVPGHGNSSPIVIGDRLYLTTAIATERIDDSLPKPADQPKRPFGITFPNQFHKFDVLAYDRATGKKAWQKTCTEVVPHEGHHKDNSFATPSIATDGERLFVWFGTPGLFCLDLNGKVLWKKTYEKVATRRSFGEASSPVVHKDTLLVIRDSEDQSYLLALDTKTGKEKWRKERDEPSAWATPFVVKHEGRTQVITNGSNRVRSYDLANGDLIWECGGQVFNVTPSPVVSGNVVLCMSGYRGSAAFGIPLNAKGDITDSDKIIWQQSRGTPYIASPALHKGIVYFNQSNQGIVSAIEAETGRVHYSRVRLPKGGSMYASPVAAKNRVYFTMRNGMTYVLQHGAKFKVLQVNQLDDGIDASPALIGNQMYIRGKSNLYCIQEEK